MPLILDLRLDIVVSIRRFDLKSGGFFCEGLHEYLHTTETQDQVEGGLLWMLYSSRVRLSPSCLPAKMRPC